jgi:hypothetical protein
MSLRRGDFSDCDKEIPVTMAPAISPCIEQFAPAISIAEG